jgi:outer membrane receptor protein involved in Fe transport
MRHRILPFAALALMLSPPARAQSADDTQRVEVTGHYDNAIGSTDAASAGAVNAALIERRPALRPGELLEFVPGVIVTQHSGDGKANQYFLRGFNLDHGTDFATFVAGMPVNMPSHAHGQGYSDLNWLLPELVERIAYRKGPYDADEGDFSSAGSARIRLADTLPRGLASLTLGEHGYERGLLANGAALPAGHIVYAVELAHNDGPWTSPEKFHRVNGVLRYSLDSGDAHTSITAMHYDAAWDATDQIPLRAVDDGRVGRFGALDPSDGGRTARSSLSIETVHRGADGEWRIDAYAIRSRLDLFSDFTFVLDDPVHGDQFEQAEHRLVLGGAASRSWATSLAGHEGRTTLGVQLRQDRVDPVGLYASEQRVRLSTTQESRVRQTASALFASQDTAWTPWLRSVAGVRADHVDFDVRSSIAANGGQASASRVSPKLSMILGPWNRTELFANAGRGFHSNDARGTTETVTPGSHAPAEPVTPLVRSTGAELGLRTEAVAGLQSSIALWQLRLGSELVFSGDAGDTEASRASLRQGVELNQHWVARPWLLVDADLSWSRARFTQHDPAGDFIPGSIAGVASLGATVTEWGRWSGQLQLRWFGPRPLVEDDSVRSASTTLASLRVGYRLADRVKFALDVFNLFDRRASDIDYFYASRLPGEPAEGVNDVHFHPVEPRSIRLTATASF